MQTYCHASVYRIVTTSVDMSSDKSKNCAEQRKIGKLQCFFFRAFTFWQTEMKSCDDQIVFRRKRKKEKQMRLPDISLWSIFCWHFDWPDSVDVITKTNRLTVRSTAFFMARRKKRWMTTRNVYESFRRKQLDRKAVIWFSICIFVHFSLFSAHLQKSNCATKPQKKKWTKIE